MTETEFLKEFLETRSDAAFAQLVQHYAGMVYSVAVRRAARVSQAEDITQLVFIRLAKAPPRLQNSAELAAWLHRTAVNISIDYWRSETRRQNREHQATIMEPADHSPALWEEIAPHLDEALNQLGADDRQAVLLRYFSEKSMHDVGMALGVSEAAAKMRVSRALDRLRTQLARRGAVCTTVAVGAMLTEHAVEAVPSSVLSNLASLRVPTAVGLVGLLGLPSVVWQIPGIHWVTGLVVIGLLAASLVRFVKSTYPPPEPDTSATQAQTDNPNRRQSLPGSGSGLSSTAPPVTPIKIVFHVLDSETGAGLANARVHAAFFGPGSEGESHKLLTDSHGDAAIPEPNDPEKNSNPNVFVSLEGYVPKVVSFSQLDSLASEYTLKLDPASTISGWVVDEAGQPVANAVVQTDWDHQGIRAYEWRTRTDEQGRFEWDSAPAGAALFWIEAPGYQTKRDQPLEPDPAGHTIVLHR